MRRSRRVCPYCHAQVPAGARSCRNCGHHLGDLPPLTPTPGFSARQALAVAGLLITIIGGGAFLGLAIFSHPHHAHSAPNTPTVTAASSPVADASSPFPATPPATAPATHSVFASPVSSPAATPSAGSPPHLDLAYPVVRPADTGRSDYGRTEAVGCDGLAQCIAAGVLVPATANVLPPADIVAGYTYAIARPGTTPGQPGRTVRTTLIQFADATVAQADFSRILDRSYATASPVASDKTFGQQSRFLEEEGAPRTLIGAFQRGSLVVMVVVADASGQAPTRATLDHLLAIVESRVAMILQAGWDGPALRTIHMAGTPAHAWYTVLAGITIPEYTVVSGQAPPSSPSPTNAGQIYRAQQTVRLSNEVPSALVSATIYRFNSSTAAATFRTQAPTTLLTRELGLRTTELTPLPAAEAKSLGRQALGFVYQTESAEGTLVGSMMLIQDGTSITMLTVLNTHPIAIMPTAFADVARLGGWPALEQLTVAQEDCLQTTFCPAFTISSSTPT